MCVVVSGRFSSSSRTTISVLVVFGTPLATAVNSAVLEFGLAPIRAVSLLGLLSVIASPSGPKCFGDLIRPEYRNATRAINGIIRRHFQRVLRPEKQVESRTALYDTSAYNSEYSCASETGYASCGEVNCCQNIENITPYRIARHDKSNCQRNRTRRIVSAALNSSLLHRVALVSASNEFMSEVKIQVSDTPEIIIGDGEISWLFRQIIDRRRAASKCSQRFDRKAREWWRRQRIWHYGRAIYEAEKSLKIKLVDPANDYRRRNIIARGDKLRPSELDFFRTALERIWLPGIPEDVLACI